MNSTAREYNTPFKIKVKTNGLCVIGSLVVMILINTTSFGISADTTANAIYTVKPGDFLVKIAVHYGDTDYWEAIYIANKDVIRDPNLIFIGQQLVIPDSIAGNPEQEATTKSENISDEENSESPTLAEFRKALSRVIRTEEEEEPNSPPQQYSGLEINGLVINETRSKIGDQFFNVFYQHWQAPDQAPDFMLTIEEKPMPSMGTLVTVLIDNTAIFQTKLQPRVQAIEQQALRAVNISYQALVQRIETANQINFY